VRHGWETKKLGEVLQPVDTVDPTKAPTKRFRYIDVSSVSNETFEVIEAAELLGKDAPSRARRKIKSGDVIFATIRPTLKRIAIVPPNLDGEVCSTGYLCFGPSPFWVIDFFTIIFSPISFCMQWPNYRPELAILP
jgi:type I restriction enzyme, S subunit